MGSVSLLDRRPDGLRLGILRCAAVLALTLVAAAAFGQTPPPLIIPGGTVTVTITPDPVTLQVNQSQTFTANHGVANCTPGTPVTRQWFIGTTDITGATSQTFTTSFAGAGQYLVGCRVSVPGCGIGSGTSTVTVNATSPSVSVSLSPTSMCAATTQVITASVTTSGCTPGAITYTFTLDGTTVQSGPGATYSASFGSAGSHTLVCDVTVANCGSATTTVTLTVAGPSQSVSVSPATVTLDISQTRIFTANVATSCCTWGSRNFVWRIGSSVVKNGPDSYAELSFGTPGPHTVSCTVTDAACGQPATGSASVTVNGPWINATVTPANATVCVGTSQQYNASFTHGSCTPGPATYAWKVNGQPAGVPPTADVTIPFTAAGTYAVTCDVSVVGCGSDTSDQATITVTNQGPITGATATVDRNQVPIGRVVTFGASATPHCNGVPLTYSWDFGDGSPPGSGPSDVHHTYTAVRRVNGVVQPYTVTVTVSDAYGDQAQAQVQVEVVPASGAPEAGPSRDGVCLKCGDDLVQLGLASGNVLTTHTDPIATRGYPLTVNISVNSQTLETNRAMGAATFTYDIHVGTQTVYDANCSSSTHWMVADGNGRRLDYGLASGAPAAGSGVFSQLVQVSGGYQLQNAGPPEAVGDAGNFTYVFDSSGRLTQVTDWAGNAQQLTYSGGQLTQVLDVNTGKAVTFVYSNGCISQVVRGGGASKSILTYTSGIFTAVSDQTQAGAQVKGVTYAYNTDGSPASVQSSGGSAISFNYTALPSSSCSGQVLVANATDSLGATQIDYKADPSPGAARSIKVTNAKGGTFTRDFNSQGDLIQVTTPVLAGATLPTAVAYSYNAMRRVTAVAVNGTQTTSLAYNALGAVTSYADALAHTWSWTYNGVDPTGGSDPVNATETLAYADPAQPHIPTTFTDSGGHVWSAGHNAYGQITSVTPPTGSPTGSATVVYNEQGSNRGYPASVTDANGNVTTFNSYDPLGDLTAFSTYPNVNTTNTALLTYDAVQRPTGVQHPDGKTAFLTYTGRDMTQTTDEAGTQYNMSYCAPCGVLTGITGPLGWTLGWTLDGDRDLSGFTDARGKVTHHTYGPAGELRQTTYPDGSTLGLLYDNAARVRQVTNGRGQLTTATYDAADRLTGVAFPTTGAPPISYAYNADNSLAQVTDAAGTTTFAYTATGQVQSVAYDYSASGLTGVQTVAYTYNPDGSRATITWTNGTTAVGTWSYLYDPGGRLTTVTNPWGEITSWNYDGEDKVTSQTNANTTSLTLGYNQARGWPTSLTWKQGATPFASYALTYDQGLNTVGNLTGVTEGAGAVSYGYDALYRLTSEARTGANANAHSYGYDLAGNRLTADSITCTFDNANKVASITGGSFGHDGDGNVTTRSAAGIAPIWASWNTLSQATQLGGYGQPMAYTYDGLGRRVAGLLTGAPIVQKTFYIFDGDLLLGEVQPGYPMPPPAPSGPQVKAAYTWGAMGLVSERLVQQSVSLWYAFGPQGETRQLTNSTGAVADTYVYTAYGAPVASTGSYPQPVPLRRPVWLLHRPRQLQGERLVGQSYPGTAPAHCAQQISALPAV